MLPLEPLYNELPHFSAECFHLLPAGISLSSPACCLPQQQLQAACSLAPVSHSDTFLLSLSSELQPHVYSKTQIFLLGPGFSWLYLGFSGV